MRHMLVCVHPSTQGHLQSLEQRDLLSAQMAVAAFAHGAVAAGDPPSAAAAAAELFAAAARSQVGPRRRPYTGNPAKDSV
jgi:hypothetical protein